MRKGIGEKNFSLDKPFVGINLNREEAGFSLSGASEQ